MEILVLRLFTTIIIFYAKLHVNSVIQGLNLALIPSFFYGLKYIYLSETACYRSEHSTFQCSKCTPEGFVCVKIKELGSF